MQLTNYIKDDMRRRIVSGEKPPFDLTLLGIASHYRVSLTPVRAAVSELLEEKILRKLPNGRLEIDMENAFRQPPPAAIAPATPPPSTCDWDRLLLGEIMHLSLKSQPEYLREEPLAKKYDVGRSIIRQTLGRLAGAGIIEHVPRCGWLVHPIREDDLTAYLQVRETLELKALQLAQPNLEQVELARLLEGNSSQGTDDQPRLDNGLHQYVIEKSGNRYIMQFFRQYTASYYTAVFDYAAPEAHVVADMANQHRQILYALMERQWDTARQNLAEHIWAQKPNLMKVLVLDE